MFGITNEIHVDPVEFVRRIMYSITNDFDGILAGIPNGGGKKLLDSCAIMGYVTISIQYNRYHLDTSL